MNCNTWWSLSQLVFTSTVKRATQYLLNILIQTQELKNISYPKLTNTQVTQDDDLTAICKIAQIAADRRWVVVRSHRAPRQRSKVSKVAEVAAKFEHAQTQRSEVAAETGRPSIAANAP